MNNSLLDPIFIQRLRDVGLAAAPLTVEAFDEFTKRDAARWAELVKTVRREGRMKSRGEVST